MRCYVMARHIIGQPCQPTRRPSTTTTTTTTTTEATGATENAGRGWRMTDQIAWLENAGPKKINNVTSC